MNISYKVDGLERITKMLNSYQRTLRERIAQFLQELGEIGVDTANINFHLAEYDGTNDVIVSDPIIKGNTMQIRASGTTVLFIEFGTGITYTEQHPKASELNMQRGTYGQGKGSQTSWEYYGAAGTNGEIVGEVEGKGTLVKTHGNPPAMAMYNASKEMKNQIEKIAKEVFKFD